MYIFLILFFVSLISIIFMIARKLVLIKNNEIAYVEDVYPFVPDSRRVKDFVYRKAKRFEHIALVVVLRIYIRFSNIFKSQYQKLKLKTLNMLTKDSFENSSPEKKEISKFLKVISEYKQKIRKIKHRIKEEEGE